MKTSKVFFIILDRMKTIPGEYPFKIASSRALYMYKYAKSVTDANLPHLN